MKTRIFSSLIIIGILFVFSGNAFTQTSQVPSDAAEYPYWIEMMQDPEANYYETVEAFNTYWADKTDRKGKGFNPFKRWEWYMKFKINEDGSKRISGEDRDAYLKYVSNQSANRNFNGAWVNLGPINLPSSPNEFWGNGRLNAIAFHPTDPDKIYVGAPSGGLWVSDDDGLTWAILTDDQPTLGVSSIIVDHSDPNVIYLGSGDRDHGDADGLGVFKSTDGGVSWFQSNTGMGNKTVGRMIQHPTNANWIYAATSNGIYKSVDGGNTWTFKQSGNMKEIVMKPGTPSTLYASGSGDFFRSTDDGETWTFITSGLPGNASRAVIDVSAANPEYVYFLASTNQAFYGLYRSTNGGLDFTQMSNSPNILGWNCNGGSGGQAWYDLDIAADPLNEEVIYAGGINCWKSTDGGATWDMSSNQTGQCGAWPVHADLHVLEWSPLNGKLYTGNDGGVWWTDDDGSSWTRITDGLAIGQQYKLGQSKLLSYHTTTGYQDNGISIYHGDTWIQTDMYADGMEAAMDNTDTTLSYGCMQYGRMYRSVNDKASDVIAGDGIGGINESGAWVTPFTQHEHKQNVMFIGYTNLWRTENLIDLNPTWSSITQNQGGTSSIAVVEHSPADPGIFYFAKQNGRVFRSLNIEDPVPGFSEITSSIPASGTPTDLEAHPNDPDVLYMTISRKVFKSNDKGNTWEEITGSLPDVSINDIAYYERGINDALYVGTNVGVFFRDNTMSDWVLYSDGLPAAILITEIEIFHHATDQGQDMIRASSFGRGLWESPPFYTTPNVDFEASETSIPGGCTIDFTDLSSGYPSTWAWTFEGGTPETSDEPNPSGIAYATPGTYFVKLVASNPDGSDSLTKTAYIMVGDPVQPTADFMAYDTITCPGAPVEFFDMSEDCPTEWEWVFDPSTVNFVGGSSAASQNPLVEFQQPGTYSVTLNVANGTGNSSVTKENYILAGGHSLPFMEDFSNLSSGNMDWYVTNTDGSNTWENHYIEAEDNLTMRMVNWGYFNLDERDQLVSPPINLDGFGGVFLNFDYSYAQRFSEVDSLIIYISDDCGTSWTRVYQSGPDGTGIFATAPNSGYPFEPASAEDWCGSGWGAECITIPLEDWIESGTIRIMFENYNGFGNNIYIDNVLVDFTYDLDEISSIGGGIKIFPNPNEGEFTVDIQHPDEGGMINVYDLSGRKVHSTEFPAGQAQTKLNLTDAGKGIYVVEIVSGDSSSKAKIIVQ